MNKENIAHYFENRKEFEQLPPFYKKLEQYTDDTSAKYDVPDLNIVPSTFHQTERFTVGYCYKRAGCIFLEKEKLIHKQGQ